MTKHVIAVNTAEGIKKIVLSEQRDIDDLRGECEGYLPYVREFATPSGKDAVLSWEILSIYKIFAGGKTKMKEEFKEKIEELKEQYEDVKYRVDFFLVSDHKLDDYIDSSNRDVEIEGMTYLPSEVLKAIDSIAYDTLRNDYTDQVLREHDIQETLEDIKESLNNLINAETDRELDDDDIELELSEIEDALDNIDRFLDEWELGD